ncbi:MAG TPA: hypothetical protein EYH07_16575 [Kiloniellaceae bacterium]|nr:hypothetical protein [Kiloniellaceae bacterium]
MLWTFEDLLRRITALPVDPFRVLSALLTRLGGKTGGAGPRSATDWDRDPLSHPALQAMSQRELGDLPFDPRALAED